jgi:hypothetical protein
MRPPFGLTQGGDRPSTIDRPRQIDDGAEESRLKSSYRVVGVAWIRDDQIHCWLIRYEQCVMLLIVWLLGESCPLSKTGNKLPDRSKAFSKGSAPPRGVT